MEGQTGPYYEINIPLSHGPLPVLPPEFEDRLVRYITGCADVGLHRTRSRVALDIQTYIRRNRLAITAFTDEKPGKVCISYIVVHVNFVNDK